MTIRTLLSFAGLVALSLMTASCCAWCEPSPQPSGDATTIYLPHEHVAAWTVATNKFHAVTTDESGDHDHDDEWTGILFQLGAFQGVLDGAWEVVIEPRTGSVPPYRLSTQKVWVNVISHASENPMDPADLKYLWPDPSKPSACQVIDECAGNDCLCPPPCDASALQKVEKDCLRNRTLHRDLTVLGVITYWNGDKGFTLNATRKDEHHLEHEFILNDQVRVEVYDLETGAELAKFGIDEIERIAVREANTQTHGIHESPPWPGS